MSWLQKPKPESPSDSPPRRLSAIEGKVELQSPPQWTGNFWPPAVAERARTRFAELGLAARTQTYGGSFWSDPLPQGADIATLVRVCFDHDDAGVLKILRAVRRALPEDGTLLLAEPMSETPGAEAMGSAYFGFYLMAMGRGRSRSADQHKALLEAAGFDRVRLLRNPMPLYTRVLSARCAPRAEHTGDMRVDTVN